MNLWTRRLIYLTFTVIFLVIVPFLIYYALGYRYNFTKRRLEKTGVIYIKSYPRHAEIYLNNELYYEKTPTQINRLLANNYQIKIIKDGYFPWSKTLPVFPQTTTFIEDVTLFKNQLKFVPLSLTEYQQLAASPDITKVILLEKRLSDNILHLYNLLNNEDKVVYQSPSKLAVDSWCPNSNKVIVKKNLDYLILNAESLTVTSFYDLFKRNFEQVKCDYYNDNIIYGLKDGYLYQLDLLAKKFTLLLNERVITFLPWRTQLIYLTSINNKYYLKSFFNQKSESILILPWSSHYQFYPSAGKEFALLDQDEAQAYLINPDDNQPLQRVLKNIIALKWYDKQMIYWNDFELLVYYPESNETILLERTSLPIQNAFWHPAYVYAFGQINNLLKIYELDSRDQRNIYELMSISDLTKDNIFINKKGDTLYLITTVDNQTGFYKIEIQ